MAFHSHGGIPINRWMVKKSWKMQIRKGWFSINPDFFRGILDKPVYCVPNIWNCWWTPNEILFQMFSRGILDSMWRIMGIWLVVWNIFYGFHILGIIIPTDFHGYNLGCVWQIVKQNDARPTWGWFVNGIAIFKANCLFYLYHPVIPLKRSWMAKISPKLSQFFQMLQATSNHLDNSGDHRKMAQLKLIGILSSKSGIRTKLVIFVDTTKYWFGGSKVLLSSAITENEWWYPMIKFSSHLFVQCLYIYIYIYTHTYPKYIFHYICLLYPNHIYLINIYLIVVHYYMCSNHIRLPPHKAVAEVSKIGNL